MARSGHPARSGAIAAILLSGAAAGLLPACGDDDASAESIVGLECEAADVGDGVGSAWAYDDHQSACDPGACLTRVVSIDGEPRSYAFCSCRCDDGYGHTAADDPSLCACPGGTACVEVIGVTLDAPDDITGSYCIPGCVEQPSACAPGEECAPPGGVANPWDWSCQ